MNAAFRRFDLQLAATCLAVAVATAGMSSSAFAQTRDDSSATTPEQGDSVDGEERTLRERLMLRLSGYHYSPSEEQFDDWEGDVAAELREIAGERGMRPSLRSRAVDTLGFFDGAETRSFLKGLLTLPDDLDGEEREAAEMLRHHAIEALARQLDGDSAVATLEQFLDVDHLQLCLTTIHALGEHAGASGKTRLEKFSRSVEDDVVRDELASYIDPSSVK